MADEVYSIVSRVFPDMNDQVIEGGVPRIDPVEVATPSPPFLIDLFKEAQGLFSCDPVPLHHDPDPFLQIGNDPHLEYMRDPLDEEMARKPVIDNIVFPKLPEDRKLDERDVFFPAVD